MDRRGGCCITRYGGVGGVYDTSKVDRILMRFRPIAPKPIGGLISGVDTPKINEKCRRGKRKYVKAKRCNNKRRKPPSSLKNVKKYKGDAAPNVTTLSFLPESPESRDFRDSPEEHSSQSWLSFDRNKEHKIVKMVRPRRVVGCIVKVDCVTDTWLNEGGLLGYTDEERRMCLDRDTCPCFVSDRYGRVVWTNEAYRSMVTGEEEFNEVTVRLVVKEPAAVAAMTCPAFTCRVRVQHMCGSLTAPCDVWRMEGGGFAWRLDLKAALCLGLGSQENDST